jgi:hypothetical protein
MRLQLSPSGNSGHFFRLWIVADSCERLCRKICSFWSVISSRKRLIAEKNSPLKAKPIALELAELIKSGKPDKRLKWKSADVARILIGTVIPDDALKQTVAGRRNRLRECWQDELLNYGWEVKPRWTVRRRASG